jgi:hypothetical protein
LSEDTELPSRCPPAFISVSYHTVGIREIIRDLAQLTCTCNWAAWKMLRYACGKKTPIHQGLTLGTQHQDWMASSYVAHRTESVVVRRIIKHVSVNLHSDFPK